MSRPKFDQKILILQGGGALGAYQAGAYQGLAEAGFLPDWVVGISIGGINSALIAGNPPERRVERLRAFWDTVSSYAPMPAEWFSPIRPVYNKLSTTAVEMFGIPGFFVPRPGGAFGFGGEGLPSVYDTSPLNETLERLIDFDLINRGKDKAFPRSGESDDRCIRVLRQSGHPNRAGPRARQRRVASRLPFGRHRW